MVNTGITVSEELLDRFDRKIAKLEAEGELPTNTPRTAVIRAIMEAWVEGNSTSTRRVSMETVTAD